MKTFVFLFFQLMRKEKQPSQEGTLKQNQDLFIAGLLMGGDLVATGTGSSLQMLFCLLCHPKAALILHLKHVTWSIHQHGVATARCMNILYFFRLIYTPSLTCFRFLSGLSVPAVKILPTRWYVFLLQPQKHNLSLLVIWKTSTVH